LPILDFRLPEIALLSVGSPMDEQTFKDRTKRLGLTIIRLIERLSRTTTADVIGRQVIRSGTSIGANYRAACRGRSTADAIAKLRIVEEQADETIYWIGLLVELGLVPPQEASMILPETNEIIAMTVASIRTLQKRNGAFNRKSKI
jgi:four helix bundle protein